MNSPRPLSWKIRLALFIPLMVMGSMPLFVYFRFEHESILLLMWLTLIIVQFVLSIHTARLAIKMMAGVRKRDGKRIHLDMTPDEAKAYPRKMLLTVFRATWLEHVMLALPRLGVALGFMQFFHMSGLWWMKTANSVFFLRPFIYYSSNYPHVGQDKLLISPDGLQLCILLLLLIGFSLFESLLVIVISLLVSRKPQHNSTFHTVALRTMIGVIGLSLFGLLNIVPATEQYFLSRSHDYRWTLDYCDAVNRIPVDEESWGFVRQQQGIEYQATGKCDEYRFHLTVLRAWEGTQFTLLSMFDSGTMLGSNILRPIIPEDQDYDWNLNYFGYYVDENWQIQSSYMPFVFRNILSALLAFGIYGVMILGMLRVARRRLVRQALSSAD